VSYDLLRFLKTITFRKALNSCCLYASYVVSRLIKKPFLWGKPIAVSIEPTTACNLSCPECPVGNGSLTRKKSFLETSTYHQIIREFAPHLSWLQLFFQGEPFLHPSIIEFIEYAKDYNLFTTLSTNGHFLNREKCQAIVNSGLDRIVISLDGTDPETYSKYRISGDFRKVIEGITTLVSIKEKSKRRHPKIILQFLVFRYNENQIQEVKNLGKKLGVEQTEIKTAQIYGYQNKKDLIPREKKYSRYLLKKGHMQLKKRMKNRCKRLWLSTVITSEGAVVPCCFDKNGEYTMGDLKNNSFSSIWKSKPYRTFRKHILQNRQTIPMCLNCSE
jgi:radical SAM protein with 4Fe4S-binding SPASM domain